jgi:threonyl-tRNA synthetase
VLFLSLGICVATSAFSEVNAVLLRDVPAMDALALPYVEARGEAAFYGPKLDIQLADVMGHEETYSTVQVDFHLPGQFDLHYVAADGKEHRPVMIHRAIVSTMERMISYLIELYAGAFPVWLAPVQAIVLPITDRQSAYARAVEKQLNAAGIRVTLDERNEKVNFKIREAQLQKIPFMLVVGDREQENGQVSVRNRKHGDQGVKPVADFIAAIRGLIESKAVSE